MKKRFIASLTSLILICAMLMGGAISANAASVATSTSADLFSSESKFKASAAYKKYSSFSSKVNYGKSIIIPGLAKTNVKGTAGTAYAPQGLTFAGDYCLISAYDRNDKLKSVIYVIKTSTKKYVTTLVLPTTAHLGGLAYDGTNVWCTVGSTMASIKYSTIKKAVSSGKDSYVISSFASKVSAGITCSYATYYDGKLWVGTFTDKGTDSYLYAYKISNKNGSSPSISRVSSTASGGYRIQLPDRVQGVTFTNNGHLVISRSYRASTSASDYISEVRAYNMKGWKSVTSSGTIQKGSATYSYTMPPMGEGLAISGNYIYLLFESAAFPSCKYPMDRVCAFKTTSIAGSASVKTFTVQYNANGGSGTMDNTTVTYGVSTALRTAAFTKKGYTQTGWYRYRTSDNKWYYTSADGSTSAWYVEGEQPSGYKKNVMSVTSSVSKTSAVDGDIVILYAVWTKNASTTTTTSSSVTYRVRCGVYSVKSNAQALVTDLTNDGFSAYIEISGSNYNVYAGAYSVKANAENQVAKLKAAGFDAVIETVKA